MEKIGAVVLVAIAWGLDQHWVNTDPSFAAMQSQAISMGMPILKAGVTAMIQSAQTAIASFSAAHTG